MRKGKPSSNGDTLLREKAETLLSTGKSARTNPENLEAIVHELEVHQVELEMQNEELRRTRAELELARARYFDLYDLAPVGYLAVSEKGLVLEANITAATLLGVTRGDLIKHSLPRFILAEDQDIYYLHRQQLFETGEPQVCELRMVRKDGAIFWALIQANMAQDEDGASLCRAVLIDITERKLAEQRLRDSEERFRLMFLHSALGMVLVSPDFYFLQVNDSFCKMLGYTEMELLGKTFQDVTFPEDRTVGGELTRRVLSGEMETFQFEKRYLRKDGTVIWGLVSSTLIRNTGNKPLYFVTQIQDITARKQAEEAIKDREEELSAIYENAPVVMTLVDEDWTIRKTNGSAAQLAGTSQSQLIGLRCGEALGCNHAKDTTEGCGFGPSCRECTLRRTVMDTVETGNSHRAIEIDMSFALKDEQKKLTFLLSTDRVTIKAEPFALVSMQDITARKEAEEALRESEQNFRTLAESMPQIVWVTRADGWNTYFNRQWVDYTGLTLEESYGHGWSIPFHPDDRQRAWDAWQNAVQHNAVYSLECRLRRYDGSYRWWLIRGVPLRSADGEIVKWFGTCTDIEDMKQAEDELRESRQQLRTFSGYLQQALEQERTRISREIHDELGQSLTGIKIDIFWLKEYLADEAKLTGHLKERIDSLIKLTDSTVQTAREISLRLRPGILDDLGLAAAVRWQAKRFEEATGIACEVLLHTEETEIGENKVTALFRICQECLANIANHARATKIEITLTEQAGNLILKVEDNGKGITKEQIKSLTSLGIMGMRERAASVGGTFSISGKPGQGTKVEVEVPL